MKTTVSPALSFTLVCSQCGKTYQNSSVNSFATCCNKPLLVSFHLNTFSKEEIIDTSERSMWRYLKLLPLFDERNIISLNEGCTPLIELRNLASSKNLSLLLLKDESCNPTGSFKARGISMAVSKARELGIDRLIVPTAGNAGGALAAYCARAKMECIVVMPEHTPAVFKDECRAYGAQLILIEGLINDCAKKVEEIKNSKDYFDVSTFKEPYRLEGKKTMGYEIAEQMDWQLPDVIVYPAGGGTGLIGIWKAFKEMVQLGWIREPLPKLIAVQSENCAPLANAMKNPADWHHQFTPLPSIANGLAVPFPFAMNLMLDAIHSSGGDVVTVSDRQILEGIKEVAEAEGILLSPEGSAAWKGVECLFNEKKLQGDCKVLFLNTASGYKSPSK